jgi:asparagine synthase (glutamine-hydrolysing)
MSAICGVIGVDGKPWTAADLDGVMRELSPLGRDGGGSWAGTTGRCGVVVAAALRHSTPEDAADRQPAQNGDGSIILVGDIRVDNRSDLAAALPLEDNRSTPDSAFVLAAYERWGAKRFLDRVIGEFSLAIVDRRRGGVLLARDHLGSRPLAVHQRKGIVAFASMPLALTSFEGVGHRLDLQRTAEALALVYSMERTFVDGVEWLPRATVAWIDESGVRTRKWWDPDPHEIVDLGSAAAHEEALRESFDLAVAARLRSSGGVAATVSGGLDSTSVAATAAGLLDPRPLLTYTSAPSPGWRIGEKPGWDADESPLVRELAKVYPNMVTAFIHPSLDADLLRLQEPLWGLGSGPTRNPCNIQWMSAISDRAAADGASTLLTGERGNLFFSADGPAWLITHLRAGRAIIAAKEAAAWKQSSGDGWYRTLRDQVAMHLLPPPLLGVARRLTNRTGELEKWLRATSVRSEVAASLDLPTRLPHLDPRRRPDLRAMMLTPLDHASALADRSAAMAGLYGIEVRDPTGDRRVLEVAIRQPEWNRRRNGITRAVVRGAMADRLPSSIVNRTQRGEQFPEWLEVMTARRMELAAELDQLEQHQTSRELIDTSRLRELVHRWPDRSLRADPAITQDYRLVLLRALVMSRYLRWFEARAERAPQRRSDLRGEKVVVVTRPDSSHS